ncbi:SGNH/GDSL hydrolase family protein [Caulobacter soli]|uniref:SGNH/GDSL hydrolase family protein n=1 Tax=Caulobacter soli TaxID=2708539 RepID=UPI0013EA9FB2|nr:SGNH/GDSL hydrolase family protein [Caulobacter soli]
MNPRHALLGWVALAWLAATPLHAERPRAPAVWIGSWASAQQPTETRDAASNVDLAGMTLRQVVHLSLGGDRIRLRLSNAFGTGPLRLSGVHVARAMAAGSPRIDPATDRTVTFAGANEVTIPAGADYLSDPVDLAAGALSDLAVSLRYDAAPAQPTLHAASHATSWTLAGDHLTAPDLPGAKTFTHWLQISGVDVARPSGAAVVALGDSITDGSWSTTDGNDRWPDILAARLQADPRTAHLGVLNVGIGGNRVLADGRGPNALARFDRDVTAQAGARYLVVLEGVNDLGTLTRDGPVSPEAHADLVSRLTAAYAQIIARGHQRGLRVYGATILPFGRATNYHPDARNEADRQAVNAWIRAPGHFDGVIDFDAATRDPAQPDQLLPAYDSGDHLHPSPAGYRAMGQAIDLTLFGPKT